MSRSEDLVLVVVHEGQVRYLNDRPPDLVVKEDMSAAETMEGGYRISTRRVGFDTGSVCVSVISLDRLRGVEQLAAGKEEREGEGQSLSPLTSSWKASSVVEEG